MNLSEYIASYFGSKRGLLRLLKFGITNAFTRRYGKYSIVPKGVKRIVFVCKGNICRSSLAEHYFKSISDMPVASIGLETETGKPANERVLQEAKSIGVDLSDHLTTAIDDFKAEDGDLYVCMEPNHVSSLELYNKNATIVLLGLFGSPKRVYIHDPYMANIEYVRFCNQYICDCVSALTKKLAI